MEQIEPVVTEPELSPVANSEVATVEAEAKQFIYFKESTNRTDAINPSSGACGLGQALPCSKLPCSLQDYQCQDQWFTNYMTERYGSWQKAKDYWNCIGSCTNNYGTIHKTHTWW